MNRLFILLLAFLLHSCSSSKVTPSPDTKFFTFSSSGNISFGYQPIDPIPVKLSVVDTTSTTSKNTKLMNSLPDESMRLAIGEVIGNMGVSFGPIKFGVKNNTYIVILDYIKYDTKPFKINYEDLIKPNVVSTRPQTGSLIVPVYVGVGLRLTATVTVREDGVDLNDFYGLGLAAQQKKVTGTLVIQTLGVSGSSISSLIPMPSELNATTIQNAILSLGAIKAKMYEEDTQITPRIVGLYNSYVGSLSTNEFMSSFLTGDITHKVGN
jgi:hypothetical protein